MNRNQYVPPEIITERVPQPGESTYVVRGRNGNAILEGMPAHVQDLLVEVDLIRIGLLLHPATRASRAAGPGAGLP